MADIIDISWPIVAGMTEYKNRDSVRVNQATSSIAFHAHTGTHVDAPAHFIPGGQTIDQLSFDQLQGPALVLDMMYVNEKITVQDIVPYAQQLQNVIILFKTKNSLLSNNAPFNPAFVYLDAQAAQLLADMQVRAVGIDYLGIERNQPGHETHKALLSHNILIIEGLRLGHVKQGVYNFICLPIYCVGFEGAPARALLIDKLG